MAISTFLEGEHLASYVRMRICQHLSTRMRETRSKQEFADLWAARIMVLDLSRHTTGRVI